MAVCIKRDDYEFILKASALGEHIDKYTSLLGLDPDKLRDFKNENDLLMHVLANDEQFKSCSQQFIDSGINRLKSQCFELSASCKVSPKFTPALGKDLGFVSGPFYGDDGAWDLR